MIVAAINWTNVLVALIAGLPAILSAVFAGVVLLKVRTPSGKSLGAVAEYAHDTAIANNLLLSTATAATKAADPATLRENGEKPPQVPVELPPNPPAP